MWFRSFFRPISFGRVFVVKKDKTEEIDIKTTSTGLDEEIIQTHPADKNFEQISARNIALLDKKIKKLGKRYISSSEPSNNVGEDGDVWFKV